MRILFHPIQALFDDCAVPLRSWQLVGLLCETFTDELQQLQAFFDAELFDLFACECSGHSFILAARRPCNHASSGVGAVEGAVAVVEEEALVVEEVEVEEVVPQIVKSKRFAIHPMSSDEAVERMELLGHGFFFFTNIETSRAAVVYRRDDGNVGLIDEAD